MPGALDVSVAGAGRDSAVLTRPDWERMAMTSATTLRPTDGAMAPGLAAALALIDDGLGAVDSAGCRRVPSAGAIHPCECYVITTGGAYYTDATRRTAFRLPMDNTASSVTTLLDHANIPAPRPGGALVVVATRPWLSIRKYGDRGYLYTHLDAAHLATNLLGTAAGHGMDAALRLRFRRAPLADLLAIRDQCREIHSVLSIEPAGELSDPQWTIYDAGSGPERPSWLERTCWRSLSPLLANGTPAPEPVAHRTLLPSGSRRLSGGTANIVGRWPRLAEQRRSSKGFTPGAVPGRALADAFAATETALATDISNTTALQLTLVTLTPRQRHFTDDDVVAACGGQDHLRHAAAGVLYHVDRAALLGHPPAVLRELLFQAGALSQLLYLGATAAGVGVTAVGGFDAGRWQRLAGLPDHQEPLYLVLLGSDGRNGVKWDRLTTAYPRLPR